jgi:hypothetical protein
MLTDAGVALMDNELDSGAFTVRPAVTVPLTLPLTPLTVIVVDPSGVFDAVVTVIVELAVLLEVSVTVAGAVNDAVAPLGRPLVLRATVPANPPVEVTDTVYVADLARSTDWPAGEI